jgi:hypothetical protein
MGEVSSIILKDFLRVQGQNGTPIDIAGAVAARSYSIPLTQEASFGLLVQFASGGTIDVAIDFEQANVRPATEQAVDANFVIPENLNQLADSITDTAIHIIAFNPVVTRYARLLLTGGATNDASTQLVKAELTYVRV